MADAKFQSEGALSLVRRHHGDVRVCFGCRVTEVPYPQAGGQPTPIVVFTHPDLPWRYFNHAVFVSSMRRHRRDALRTVAWQMLGDGRPGCFEIDLPAYPRYGAPADAVTLPLPACETSWLQRDVFVWERTLMECGFSAVDELLVMGQFLSPDSLPDETHCAPLGPIGREVVPGWDIRVAEPFDADVQVRLHRAGFESRRSDDPSEDELRLARANVHAGVRYIHIVEPGTGVPVGSAALLPRGPSAEMFAVSVLPQWRGRGLGTMLVGAGMRLAVEYGCRFIYLDVEPQSPAIKLYRRLGLTPLWRRVTYSMT